MSNPGQAHLHFIKYCLAHGFLVTTRTNKNATSYEQIKETVESAVCCALTARDEHNRVLACVSVCYHEGNKHEEQISYSEDNDFLIAWENEYWYGDRKITSRHALND